MAFLPVAVPGGQGGRPVYIDPDEVVAIIGNDVANTTTSIVLRHHPSILQVVAPDKKVLEALQCGLRVQSDCRRVKEGVTAGRPETARRRG